MGYQPILVSLKELLGKFDLNLKDTDGTDVYNKSKIQWLLMSLDGFSAARDLASALSAFQIADHGGGSKKEAYGSLCKAARAAQIIADRLDDAKVEDDATFSAEDPADVLQWAWLDKMIAQLSSPELVDALQLRESHLMREVEQAHMAVAKSSKGMADPHGDSSWKLQLAADAKIETILATAKADDSLTSIDGALFVDDLSRLQQVLAVAFLSAHVVTILSSNTRYYRSGPIGIVTVLYYTIPYITHICVYIHI